MQKPVFRSIVEFVVLKHTGKFIERLLNHYVVEFGILFLNLVFVHLVKR